MKQLALMHKYLQMLRMIKPSNIKRNQLQMV